MYLFGAMLGTRSDTEELLEDLVVRVGTDPTLASCVSVVLTDLEEVGRLFFRTGPTSIYQRSRATRPISRDGSQGSVAQLP